MLIKTRREAAGLLQSEFAKKLGVARTVVANWESGASDPRARDLPKIAKALNCTIDELYAKENAAPERTHRMPQPLAAEEG